MKWKLYRESGEYDRVGTCPYCGDQLWFGPGDNVVVCKSCWEEIPTEELLDTTPYDEPSDDYGVFEEATLKKKKKPVGKKAPAKKPTAKKPAGKKASAKKTPVKKTPLKKTPVKKVAKKKVVAKTRELSETPVWIVQVVYTNEYREKEVDSNELFHSREDAEKYAEHLSVKLDNKPGIFTINLEVGKTQDADGNLQGNSKIFELYQVGAGFSQYDDNYSSDYDYDSGSDYDSGDDGYYDESIGSALKSGWEKVKTGA